MSHEDSANFQLASDAGPASEQPLTAVAVGSGDLLGRFLSPELQRQFPKLSRPRKPRRCRLCYGKIEIGEPCCRWEYLEPGEGYGTSYAHPECYQVTIDSKWDEGDWECCSPGDVTRPNRQDEPRRS